MVEPSMNITYMYWIRLDGSEFHFTWGVRNEGRKKREWEERMEKESSCCQYFKQKRERGRDIYLNKMKELIKK